MVGSSDAKTIFNPLAQGYSRRIDLYLHEVREKNAPQSNQEVRTGKQSHAILLSPLIMQFFSFGEVPKAPATEGHEDQQYLANENAATSSDDSSKNSENSFYLSGSDPNQQSMVPTDSYQPTSNDTSIVDLLPTITTPFFDSITHAIVGEIQQHVQLIKPGRYWLDTVYTVGMLVLQRGLSRGKLYVY